MDKLKGEGQKNKKEKVGQQLLTESYGQVSIFY
jgi:hypothetical protein